MDYKVKEPLKTENVERDIKKHYIGMSIAYIVLAVVWVVCFAFVEFLFEIKSLSIDIVHKIFFVVAITAILYYLCRFGFSMYKCLSFKKKYRIEEDRLIDKGIRKSMRIGSGVIRSSHVLRFKKYGNFFGFATDKLYPWSENYSDIGYFNLFDKSYPGEDFYLATVGKRIIAIYNKKMFEYFEEK